MCEIDDSWEPWALPLSDKTQDTSAPRHRQHVAVLLGILVLAAGLRFGGITDVGIRFVDEGAYAGDARLWHRCAKTLASTEAIGAILSGDKGTLKQAMDREGVDFSARYLKPSQGYTFFGALTMFVAGVRWLITDPQYWHYRTDDQRRSWVFEGWKAMCHQLEEHAVCVAQFDHISDYRWEFLAEGPGTHLLDDMTRDRAGPLRIYDLQTQTSVARAGGPTTSVASP
jgi:hypothetical protein